MELGMIKPFKITKTVVEPEGSMGVHFTSTKSVVNENNSGGYMTLTAYISVSPDADIEQAVFEYLEAGWL
jgi:hypothetical protein